MKQFFAVLALLLPLLSNAATSNEEAYKLVKEKKAVMIDVREENEVKDGMIDQSIWFPLSKIEKDKNWEKEFKEITKDKKIFLYCRSGRRSGKVMTLLKEKGIPSENLGGYEDIKKNVPAKITK